MYYEDFDADRQLTTRTRVVTGTDIDLFASLTHAINPLFLSDDAAKAAGQPARMTPGPLLFSLTIGLCYQTGMFDHIVAMAGVNNMRFLRPAHPGDSLTAITTLLKKTPTKKADRGAVMLEHELKNQKDETVLTAQVTYLMRTREPALEPSEG